MVKKLKSLFTKENPAIKLLHPAPFSSGGHVMVRRGIQVTGKLFASISRKGHG